MMSNKTRSVVYIGVTSDLMARAAQHRSGETAGFTRDYQRTALVYFSRFEDTHQAIAWEKQLKGWCRAKKDALVERDNPRWEDSSADWL